jgi:hypothetical protein
MEKKSHAPKIMSCSQKEGGLKRQSLLLKMSCRYCKKELSDDQKYYFLRGKSQGFCSILCAQLFREYETPEKRINLLSKSCIVCGCKFELAYRKDKKKVCSLPCAGRLASVRMTNNNPMFNEGTKRAVSDTLKRMKHRPSIAGGNGRGLTVPQKYLFEALLCFDESFKCEYVFATKTKEARVPSHYKIDIASPSLMIAVEVDGTSHKSLKIKQCDEKKNQFLASKGWKVFRFWNKEVMQNTIECAKTVMSMI